jgi:hypothetical protein
VSVSFQSPFLSCPSFLDSVVPATSVLVIVDGNVLKRERDREVRVCMSLAAFWVWRHGVDMRCYVPVVSGGSAPVASGGTFARPYRADRQIRAVSGPVLQSMSRTERAQCAALFSTLCCEVGASRAKRLWRGTCRRSYGHWSKKMVRANICALSSQVYELSKDSRQYSEGSHFGLSSPAPQSSSRISSISPGINCAALLIRMDHRIT